MDRLDSVKMKIKYDIDWLIERFESGETLKYIFFWGHENRHKDVVSKSCFSQWFDCPFKVDSVNYKTSEHWMMAHKALLFGDDNLFDKIINCEKPGEAKELGRQILGYDQHIWNEHKFEIVKLGNIHKFNQHPRLANYLLQTENRILVEASPVDVIWGIGIAVDNDDIENIYNWRGENLLGFALMYVRDFFKQFGHFKPLENSIQPPWKKFPNMDSNNMFWRMGKGEDYLTQFSEYYNGLDDREKMIFKMTNTCPYEWQSFYD